MKRIIAIALFLGFVGIQKAEAVSVISTTYTAVCVTGSSLTAVTNTGGDMELCFIAYSSGSSSPADSFLLLFDTPTIYNNNAPNQDPSPLGALFSTGLYTRWLPSQMLLPPIVLFSTANASAGIPGASGFFNMIELRDAQGNGIPISSNLVGFKHGTDYGTVVTYGIRKRRTSAEH
jgi:hypothetical protein